MPTIYSANYHPSVSLFHDSDGYYHLIYMIVNKINNKIYIGKHSTNNPYDNYMGSGIAIHAAINKYGECNFEKVVIDCLTTEDEAYIKESEIVDENFVKRSDTYNMKCGGEGFGSGENNPMHNVHRYGKDNPFFNKKHSEETRLRMTLNHADFSGEKNPFYGKHLSKEAKDKISKANKGKFVGEKSPFYGKKHSQVTRDKISKNHADVSGEKNPFYGKHLSKEAKDKISKANKGKFVGEKSPMYGKHPSKEARDLMRKNHANVSGNNNPNAKSVLKLDKNGNIITKYETIKDCRNQECIYQKKFEKLIKEHILYNGFYFVIETPKDYFK